MAISYKEWSAQQEARQQNNSDAPRIGYFALKNDGDQALVRFMYQSTDEFEVINIHKNKVNGKVRSVACIQDKNNPNSCPLCARHVPVSAKAYIKLFEYEAQPNGTVTPVAKVWERPAFFFQTLATRMTTYGPLIDSLYVITRHGKAGETNTTYDILPAPPTYSQADYPIDPNAFEGYNPVGSAVFSFTADDFAVMLDNEGNIETARKQSANRSAAPVNQTIPQPIANTANQATIAPPLSNPTAPVTPATPYRSYTPTQQSGFNRPQRFSQN